MAYKLRDCKLRGCKWDRVHNHWCLTFRVRMPLPIPLNPAGIWQLLANIGGDVLVKNFHISPSTQFLQPVFLSLRC